MRVVGVWLRKYLQLVPERGTECKCVLMGGTPRLQPIIFTILRSSVIDVNACTGKNIKRILRGIGDGEVDPCHAVPSRRSRSQVGARENNKCLRAARIGQDCRSQLVSGYPDCDTVCPSVARATYFIARDTRIGEIQSRTLVHFIANVFLLFAYGSDLPW
jgi:hypothetical protein